MAAEFTYGGLTGYEPISEVDRKEFHEQGFLLLRNVLSEDHRAALEAAVDRVYARGEGEGQHHQGRHPAPARLPRARRTVRRVADPPGGLPVHVGPGRLEHLHPPQPPRRDAAGTRAGEALLGLAPGRVPAELRPGDDGPQPAPADVLAQGRLRALRPVGEPVVAPPRSSRAATCGTRCPAGRPQRAQPRPRGHRRDHREPGRRVRLRPSAVALALHQPLHDHPQDAVRRLHLPVDPAAATTLHARPSTASGAATGRRCSVS